jgi:hypothetical protein
MMPYCACQPCPSFFRSAATYAEGAERLESWKALDLLFPRDFRSDPALYENLSLDEYAREARIRRLGHTPAILEKRDFLLRALPSFPQRNARQAETISSAIERLDKLQEQKITAADSLFIAQAAGLFAERKKLGHGWQAQYGIIGFSSGLFFWFICFLAGKNIDFLFMAAYAASLGGIFFGLALRYGEFFRSILASAGQSGERYGRDHEILGAGIVFIAAFLALIFLFFRQQASSFPHIVPFLAGVLPGCAFSFGMHQRALSRNAESIIELCGSYAVLYSANENLSGRRFD